MDIRICTRGLRKSLVLGTVVAVSLQLVGVAQQTGAKASQQKTPVVESSAPSGMNGTILLPILGKGTANFIPLWNGSYTVGNSILSQSAGMLVVSGNVSARSFIGDGSALTNVNANVLDGLTASAFVQAGASNTFTGDQTIAGSLNVTGFINNSLMLQGNLADALGQQGANVSAGFGGIPGAPGNSIAAGVIGATIGGGGGLYDPSSIPESASKPLLRVTRFGRPSGPHTQRLGTSVGAALTSGANIVAAGGNWSTIGGGVSNSAAAFGATVGGGFGNNGTGSNSTVGGGVGNNGVGENSFVGGGIANNGVGANSVVSGGVGNNGTGDNSVVLGGESNTASGLASMVPGGSGNTARGDFSLAAGTCAIANFNSSFVWSGSNSQVCDPSSGTTQDTGASQFVAEAYGGFYFYTSTGGASGSGAVLPAGSGSWSSLSDRSAKANFTIIDNSSLLEKLASMPVSIWNYRDQPSTIHHLGPTAQDFHQAFGLGEDERHISTVDAEGVALAGIQALYAELKQALAAKDRELEELRARILRLEQSRSPVQAN